MKQERELHGPGHALERLIFFSDAVFAIAITLLVIEIHVPEFHHPTSDRDFLVAMAQLLPNFIGFFVSFFVVGAFWAGHHRAFDCARRWSPRLVVPNLMLLSAVAAMPFFTAFSSDYYGERVPTAFYCGWMMWLALLNIWVQRIATSPPVVGEHITREHRTALRQRGVAVLLGAATALTASLFAPRTALALLVTIPVWRLLLARLWPRPA